MARYLAKRGPGMHHICFEVDSLTEVLSVLKAQGIRLIDETPRIGGGGKRIAFIHPDSTYGVLVELCELVPS
jgi:methylmalonyl-CoA/ethylmalonyl-CoA epimerase